MMSNSLKIGILCLSLGLISCEKEYTLNGEINAGITEMLPASNFRQKIEPASEETLRFSWNPVSAKDGGVILYEVLFDREEGDFSKPVYTLLSNNSGTQNEVTVDQKTLNKIASAAGVQSMSSGTLKWTVAANKGISSRRADEANALILERPMGFAEFPTALSLVGDATESADDASNPERFRLVEEGVYELYTSLKPGTYQFKGAFNDGERSFFLDGNGTLAEGEGATTADAAELVRLTIDFNTAQSSIDRITHIHVFMPAYNASIGTLAYSGRGTWIGEQIKIDFFPFDWGNDERYKFELGTDKGVEYLGSTNVNNSSPVEVPASYFFLFPVTSSPWDNTYKFHPEMNGKVTTITVRLGDVPSYTHEVRSSD